MMKLITAIVHHTDGSVGTGIMIEFHHRPFRRTPAARRETWLPQQ